MEVTDEEVDNFRPDDFRDPWLGGGPGGVWGRLYLLDILM